MFYILVLYDILQFWYCDNFNVSQEIYQKFWFTVNINLQDTSGNMTEQLLLHDTNYINIKIKHILSQG